MNVCRYKKVFVGNGFVTLLIESEGMVFPFIRMLSHFYDLAVPV